MISTTAGDMSITVFGTSERWAESIRKAMATHGPTEALTALYRAVVDPATDAERLALIALMRKRLEETVSTYTQGDAE